MIIIIRNSKGLVVSLTVINQEIEYVLIMNATRWGSFFLLLLVKPQGDLSTN